MTCGRGEVLGVVVASGMHKYFILHSKFRSFGVRFLAKPGL